MALFGRQKGNSLLLFKKQSLRYVYNDYSPTYQELLDKGNRPLIFTNRLRCMISIVNKRIKGIFPVYLNALFQISGGSIRRRLNRLTQPKYDSSMEVIASGIKVPNYGMR